MARKGRIEDHRLVTGQGRFTDDMEAPGALWAVFVRSPFAFAHLRGIDRDAACAMPGVVAVLDGQDLVADGVAPVQAALNLTGPDGTKWGETPRPLLVSDTVRHLGEPLALVIADTRARAQDAAEAVELDLEELPAVTTIDAARAEGAPVLHAERPGNLAYQWGRGDWAAAGEVLGASAHHVQISVPVTRVTAVAMEPRCALARPEPGGRLALFCSMQRPTGLRPALAEAFAMDPGLIRCVSGDVGGSFGMKAGLLREEMLIFWAAKRLGRAVRWRADRSEDFLSDEGGRDLRATAELGLDAAGNFTALRVGLEVNAGAYASARSASPVMNFGGVAGVYKTPVIAGRIDAYLTNTVPVGAYRGAARPEATLIIESLIDHAARQLGMDRIELRRRNLIPASAMPWTSPFIFNYDSGDFAAVLDAGVLQGDVAGFPARRKLSESQGKLRGLGVVMCIETAGGTVNGPGRDWTDVEIMPDGTVRVAAGSFSAGSGLETAFTDLAAEALNLPASRIAYVQGDTDILAEGAGMGGSGGMIKGGSALMDAAEKVIALARDIASEELEAAAADIDYTAGTFRIMGTDRVITLQDVAKAAEKRAIRLIGNGEFATQAPTFPNGCHLCEVEIDPETGKVTPLSYSAIEDIGRVLNPQLAEGQIHGGVAQALGQVFMEQMRYGPGDGQLLTGSLMDYAMPRAQDLPMYAAGFLGQETAINPLGVKGVGEAGSVGGLAASMNAVLDALSSAGIDSFEMPASPARIWAALQARRYPAEDSA